MRHGLRIGALVIAAAVPAAVVSARQPRITNGRITTLPAGSLGDTFRTAVTSRVDAAWIGYAVPVVDGQRVMCCFNSGTMRIDGHVVMSDGSACCGTCGLEPSEAGTRTSEPAEPPSRIKLEGADDMLVLFRAVNRQVERVRIFSEDCQLDAGGRDVIWLTGVRPAESIMLLEAIVTQGLDARSRIADRAIGAIALHQDPAADAALERLLATTQPDAVRTKVPFWLGNARGRRGIEILRRIANDDPSPEVKKKAVFGIAQSRESGVIDLLVENARRNSDAAVRGEAIFWLAQKAGSKAASTISERIDQDPDTDVKKRAVFALSQLPRDESIPLLIQVARTHSNPAVKKQAIFWLGQSKDPRALDYFAEILK